MPAPWLKQVVKNSRASAAAFQYVDRGALTVGMQLQPQCRCGRLQARFHWTKSNRPAMAFLGSQLQTPAGLIIQHLSARKARRHRYPKTMPARRTRVFRWHPSAVQSTVGKDRYRTAVTRVDTVEKAALPRQSSPVRRNPAATLRSSDETAPASTNVTRRCRTVRSGSQSAHRAASLLPANAGPAPHSRWTTRLWTVADCAPARLAGSPAICRVTMTRLNATACRRG